MKEIVEKITRCRFCDQSQLQTFLTLRPMPKPNAFLKNPAEPEEFFPLAVCRCLCCGLVQLTHMVDPAAMFDNYVYASAMSTTMMQHFDEGAQHLVKFCSLQSDVQSQQPLVIDIGSNDGSWLQYFKQHGVRVLGVDPAQNIAADANQHGVETHVDYFGQRSARDIVARYGQAQLIVGANVFAHIDDLHDVMHGIDIALAPRGMFVMEFPYFVDLVERNEFDTIYHEHRYYFLLKPLVWLLKKYGFEIHDVQHFPIHGGSVRIAIQRSREKPYSISPAVNQFLALEQQKGMYHEATYRAFAQRVEHIRTNLLELLHNLKQNGKRIIGYGASAKGNVLLNYCGIGPDLLEYIVDNTPYKQGLYTPGVHIPVMSEEQFNDPAIDYALLLIWNFKDEVLAKQSAFRKRGGKFIVAIPEVQIL